jgi:hypothetical protein
LGRRFRLEAAAKELLDAGATAVSADQRLALKLLAGSPDGCIISIMLAHRLKPELL